MFVNSGDYGTASVLFAKMVAKRVELQQLLAQRDTSAVCLWAELQPSFSRFLAPLIGSRSQHTGSDSAHEHYRDQRRNRMYQAPHPELSDSGFWPELHDLV